MDCQRRVYKTYLVVIAVLVASSHVTSSPMYGPVFLYRRPIDAMVDITNDLGVAVLQDHVGTRSNFAFSPYGVASVLVLLYEGARGESARQIHDTLRFPWERDVTRIGFRDIHRHLRTYFSHEGYLSGITLSKNRTSLLPEYQRVLRFYGYDVSRPPTSTSRKPEDKTSGPVATTPDGILLVIGNGTSEEQETTATMEATTATVREESMTGEEDRETTTEGDSLSTGETSTVVETSPGEGDTTEMGSGSVMTTVEGQEATTMEEVTEVTTVESQEATTMEEVTEVTTASGVTIDRQKVTDGDATTTALENTTTSVDEDVGGSTSTEGGTTLETSMEVKETVMEVEETTQKVEATTEEFEGTTLEVEVTTKEFEGITQKVEVTTKEFEGITQKVEVTTKEFEETTQKVEATTDGNEGTTFEIEATTKELEGTTKKVEATTQESDGTTQKREETTEKMEDTTSVIKVTSQGIKETATEVKETTNIPIEPSETTPFALTSIVDEFEIASETKTPGDVIMSANQMSTSVEESTTTNPADLSAAESATDTEVPLQGGSELGGQTRKPSPEEDSDANELPGTVTEDTKETEQNTTTTTTTAPEEGEATVGTTLAPEITASEDVQTTTMKELFTTDSGDFETTEATESTSVDSVGTTGEVESTLPEDTTVETTETEGFTSPESTTTVEQETSPKMPIIFMKTVMDTKRENSSTRGPRNRRRRALRDSSGVDYPDMSLQLQNGMYGSSVARGVDLVHGRLPRAPFLVDGVVQESVPVMRYTSVFPFAFVPRLHAHALEFPLDDERYKLLLILPTERRGLRQLIHDLGACPLREVFRALVPTRVRAVIPSFMVEGFVILTSTLQQMGIWDVFDPRRSDLSGMSGDPELYVRNIEQSITVVIRNYVEIVDIQTRTMAARSPPEVFLATHPFLYFVVDAETRVSLMAGKIVDPLNSRIY